MMEFEDSFHVRYLCFPSVMETAHEMWLQMLWGSNQGHPDSSVSSAAQSCPTLCDPVDAISRVRKAPGRVLEEERHGQILRGWL